MEKFSQTRRSFLTRLVLLGGGLGLLWRYLTPQAASRRRVLVRVASAEIPSQGALVYREDRLALLRDASGVYALSLVCTHLGCTVTVAEGKLSCPCHGSSFDRKGAVLKGPAPRALERLTVEERDGMVEVLTG